MVEHLIFIACCLMACVAAFWLGIGIGKFSLFAEKVLGWLMFGLVLESMPAIIKVGAWAQSKESAPSSTDGRGK